MEKSSRENCGIEKITFHRIHKEHGVSYSAIRNRVLRLNITVFTAKSKTGSEQRSINIDDLDKLKTYDWRKDPNRKMVAKVSKPTFYTNSGSKDQNDNRKMGLYMRISAYYRIRTEQGVAV